MKHLIVMLLFAFNDEKEARKILREGNAKEIDKDFMVPFHVIEDRIKILF